MSKNCYRRILIGRLSIVITILASDLVPSNKVTANVERGDSCAKVCCCS